MGGWQTEVVSICPPCSNTPYILTPPYVQRVLIGYLFCYIIKCFPALEVVMGVVRFRECPYASYIHMPLYIWMPSYVCTLPYVWTPPICLDAALCLDAPYIWGHLNIWWHPNILGHPNIQGHMNMGTYGHPLSLTTPMTTSKVGKHFMI